MQTMVSYVDLAMVGSMGVNAAASVTINTSLLWMINGIIWGPVTGFSVLTATAVGQNDPEKVKKIMRQAITAMLLLGLIMLTLIEGIAQFFARVMGAEPDIIPDARGYLMLIGFYSVSDHACSLQRACAGPWRHQNADAVQCAV